MMYLIGGSIEIEVRKKAGSAKHFHQQQKKNRKNKKFHKKNTTATAQHSTIDAAHRYVSNSVYI